MPQPRKAPEQLRRAHRAEEWVILPHAGCDRLAPTWPLPSKASAAEAEHWRHVWSLPAAAYWWEVSLSPHLVASYVRLYQENATSPRPSAYAALLRMELALGLSPEGMAKLKLRVEHSEPVKAVEDPYASLKRKRRAS
jgi:hypothetical protein